MTRPDASSRAAVAALLTSALLLVPGQVQSRDRIPPTQPTNLTVTGTTAYTVSLRWNPSRDNSGQFSYVICCANVSDEEVAGSATSHTYRNGLEEGRPFSLRIYAVDAAGNFSKPSNTVSGTLPQDTTPPTQPAVAVSDVGSTYVTLDWLSDDDGPHVWYTVYRDGIAFIRGSSATSGSAFFLEPETAYTFMVQAGDFAGHSSPFSTPLTVATAPINPDDRSPPTVPGNLRASGPFDDDGEIRLTWEQSVDDFDPQHVIRYNIHVNGVFDNAVIGAGRQTFYLTQRGSNTITVTAEDTAGNVSAAASVTVQF